MLALYNMLSCKDCKVLGQDALIEAADTNKLGSVAYKQLTLLNCQVAQSPCKVSSFTGYTITEFFLVSTVP